MKIRESQYFSFITKLVVSMVLLVFLFQRTNVTVIMEIISRIDIFWFAISILVFFPSLLVASYRWYFILYHQGNSIRYSDVVRYVIIGQFSSLFLPGQVSGDIVKAVSVSKGRSDKISLVKSIVIDKMALLAGVSVLGLIGSLSSTFLITFRLAQVTALLLLIFSIASIIIINWYRPVSGMFSNFGFILNLPRIMIDKIAHMDLYSGCKLSALHIIVSILMAIALQIINSLGSFFLIKSMGISISFLDWFTINSFLSVIQIAPISIGGLGVREGFTALTLSYYGVSQTMAITFSLFGFFVSSIILTILWAATSLWVTEGAKLSDRPL